MIFNIASTNYKYFSLFLCVYVGHITFQGIEQTKTFLLLQRSIQNKPKINFHYE